MKYFKEYFYLKESNSMNAIDFEFFERLKNDILNDIINRSNNNEIDNINIASFNLPSLPNLTNFKVTRNFKCSSNKLTTLIGSPRLVGEDFYCSGNNLISLKGAPKRIGDSFFCNNDSSLKYLKDSGIEYIGGDMDIIHCHNIQEDQWQYLPVINGALKTSKVLNRNELLTLQKLKALGRIGRLELTGKLKEIEDDNDPFNL